MEVDIMIGVIGFLIGWLLADNHSMKKRIKKLEEGD